MNLVQATAILKSFPSGIFIFNPDFLFFSIFPFWALLSNKVKYLSYFCFVVELLGIMSIALSGIDQKPNLRS